ELLGAGVEGILVIAAHEGMSPAVSAVAGSSPVVVVSAQPSRESRVDMVGIDQALGARMVVEHLQRTGARSLVHLAGPTDWFDAAASRPRSRPPASTGRWWGPASGPRAPDTSSPPS